METEKLIKTCPEYENRNVLIRKLFWARINIAANFSDTKEKKQGNILDIGCGRAKLFEVLSKCAPKANKTGIDVEKDIKKLKIRNSKFIPIKPNSKFPFKNKQFDEIFALDCLEHIEKLDFEIKEIKRVLKNKGTLVISGPTENFIYRLARLLLSGKWKEVYDTGEEHAWNVYQIKKKLVKYGFKLEKSKILPFAVFPLFIVYKFRKGNEK